MRTNVLYVFADQLSMLALRLAGSPNGARTPHIDRLAERGVCFASSYCTTPQCSPSRSSILTGLYPHRTKVVGNIDTPGTADLDPALPNIGSFLADQGYVTGWFGKWHLGHAPITEYGFHRVHEVVGNDQMASEKAKAFIREQQGNSWLCMVSLNNPHDIYHVGKEKRAGHAYPTDTVELPPSFHDTLETKPAPQREFRDHDQGRPYTSFEETDWKYYIGYYNSLVETIDRQLGELLQTIEDSGQQDRTLVVFTSDHGDMMGSHRTPFKGPMMYEELVRIPLIFAWPGHLPQGEIRRQLALNTDHWPTIADLLDLPLPEGIDGRSLKSAIMNAEAPGRKEMVLQYYSKQQWVNPIRTLLRGSWKYNLYLSGEEELYDMSADPHEVTNLAASPEAAERKQELKRRLCEWIQEQQDPFFSSIPTDRAGTPVQ